MLTPYAQIRSYCEEHRSATIGGLLLTFPNLTWNCIDAVLEELVDGGVVRPLRGYGWVYNG